MTEEEDKENSLVLSDSHIIVNFNNVGSSEFSYHYKNVTPNQLLAMSAYFDEHARKLLRNEMEKK